MIYFYKTLLQMQSLVDLCANVLRNNIKFLNFLRLPTDLHQSLIKKLKDKDFKIKPLYSLNWQINNCKEFYKNIKLLREYNITIPTNGIKEQLAVIEWMYNLQVKLQRSDKERNFINVIEYIRLEQEFFEPNAKFIGAVRNKIIEIYPQLKKEKYKKLCQKYYFEIFGTELK